MPFRIRTKLFIALVGANALLVLMMYLGSSWSFERQFRDYLMHQEDAKLESLMQVLAQRHAQSGNWDWLRDDRREWFGLLRQYLSPGLARPARAQASKASNQPPSGEPRDHSPPNAERNKGPMPPPPQPITLSPVLFVLDETQRMVVGPPKPPPDAELKPIEAQGTVIGYLGFVRRTELVDAMDLVFAKQQDRNVIVIALAMLLTAVLLAAGIAYHLGTPIQQLARGTRELIEGRYEARTSVAGHDELAQLAAHFNTLAQTLEANRAARRQWIADIAHELRTPLAILQGEVEALQDGIRQLGPESLNSLAQEITRLSRLVDDLHTLSLSDLGALSYKKDSMDLNRFLTELMESHRLTLGDASIEMEVVRHGDNRIFGDATRLRQLFANLIQNTLRYTDKPGKLRIRLNREDDRTVVDWEDSSPGVADGDFPFLTDRLFRAEDSRNRASGGSGLGLAIVRAIVDAHDGTIQARRSELGGLWWRITFPTWDGAQAHG